MTFCDRCGRELQDHEICEFDGKELCEDCLNSHTAVCIHCDERIWEEHNAGTISIPLCQHCYDAHYTNCEHCGTLLSYDDACYLDDNEDYPYCQSCYEEKFSKTMIKNYHFKPDPHFYGDDIRYFGVELEIDEGGENPCHAEEILGVANAGGKEYLYCKHDGSLDDGFEMVTHPMTLDFHMTKMPWEQILDRAIRMKYQSRSDFILYNGELYMFHAPINREHIGILHIDRTNLASSSIVLQAHMQSSCFYPFVQYFDESGLAMSYTVARQHIRLGRFSMEKYI